MTLKDLLKDYSNITLATHSDNQDILEYYGTINMSSDEGGVEYHRGHDFFCFMKEKSQDYLIFLLRNDCGEIKGIATVSYRKGFIDGREQVIGYLGDLRVSLDRKLIRQWRKCFGAFIRYSPEMIDTFFCRYYQTVLMDDNQFSRVNLAATKIPGLVYVKRAPYQMVNILGRVGAIQAFPYQFFTLAQRPDLKHEVVSLLDKDHQTLAFGHVWQERMDFILENWEGMSEEDILLILDEKDEIIGVTSFWAPASSKSIKINKVPRSYRYLSALIKIVPWVKMYPLPEAKRNLKIKYVNQISFKDGLDNDEKRNIFSAIISYAIEKFEDLNFLSYCDFSYDDFLKGNSMFITYRKKMALYTVHCLNHENLEMMFPINQPQFAFDMALV